MRSTSLLIGIAYGSLVLLVTAMAVWFAASTRGRRQVDERRAAEREKLWLALVSLALAALLAATIVFVPYGESAGDEGQVVRVVGRQFGWQITPAQARVGEPVEFRLESPDVNHGFGIYDEDERLVTQTQVIPGREQRLVVTFDDPGRYRILCLEFCGVDHHRMTGQFEVLP
jgi:cytochrome c oxidase subunit 2